MKRNLSLRELTKLIRALPDTTDALLDYDRQEFYNWQGERLGNDLFINDPERAERIHDAAEDGADGSTHAEHIDDFRDYAKEIYGEVRSAIFHGDIPSDKAVDVLDAMIDRREERLEAVLDRLEAWHEKNGTLWQQVG